MLKSSILKTMVLTLCVGLPSGAALQAADATYHDEDKQIYRDGSYIDKALDDFEKRHGHNRLGQERWVRKDTYHPDDQSDRFATHERDSYEKGHSYSEKDTPLYQNDPYAEDYDKSFKDRPKHQHDHQDLSKAEQCEKPQRYTYSCLRPRQIRRHLRAKGWHDFHMLRKGPHRVRLIARNHRGRQFKLVVDRCDGVILVRRPVRWSRSWRHSFNHRY